MAREMSIEEIQKQKDWIYERIETSHTGKVIIKDYLIKKYRKLTDDVSCIGAPNWFVRTKMIEEFKDYI